LILFLVFNMIWILREGPWDHDPKSYREVAENFWLLELNMPFERAQKVSPVCKFSALPDKSLLNFDTSNLFFAVLSPKNMKFRNFFFFKYFYHKNLIEDITIIHQSIERNQLYKTRLFSHHIIVTKPLWYR